jgi:hypothetical protein
MFELLAKIIEIIKSSFTYIFTIFIVSCLLIFLPKQSLEFFNLLQFREDYKPWISLTFFVSFSLIIISLIKNFSSQIIRNRDNFNQIKNLPTDEKVNLALILLRNTRTLTSKNNDRYMLASEKTGIFTRLNHLDKNDSNEDLIFYINDWAFGLIKKHPELVLPLEQLEKYRKENQS